MLPRLSDGGIHSEADLSGLPVSQKVDGLVYPAGGDVHQFAYSRTTIHRNIYRIPIERGIRLRTSEYSRGEIALARADGHVGPRHFHREIVHLVVQLFGGEAERVLMMQFVGDA